MMMATAMRISGANTMRRTRLLTRGLWPRPGGRVAATRALQRVAHAACDTADDDHAASDPVEVAIQTEASSVWRDSRPRTTKAPQMQGLPKSAPERIRTSDLRFRRLLARVSLSEIRRSRAESVLLSCP